MYVCMNLKHDEPPPPLLMCRERCTRDGWIDAKNQPTNQTDLRRLRSKCYKKRCLSSDKLQKACHIHKHSFPLAVPAATHCSVGWNWATAGTAVMPSPPSCASCSPSAV